MSSANGEDGPPPSSVMEDQTPGKAPSQSRQANVNSFWAKFYTKYPGTVTSVLPADIFAQKKSAKAKKGKVDSKPAAISYDQAVKECKRAVEKISKESRRINQKYRDQHFDIESDLKYWRRDCLEGLIRPDERANPKAAKRVADIFKKPQFYIDEASASDVRQGRSGDCWFLSAVSAISNKKNLIDRICVARDEAVGVYGFVFHRDGEWFHTIIDDKLYLITADWYEARPEEKSTFQSTNGEVEGPRKYKEALQTGSRALYFAQCREENETWLPLLEKAFAKAHGDYDAIEGGSTGEGIEDLTGGVTTKIFATDILDREKFWNDEIKRVNKEFLFSCSTGAYDNWQMTADDYADFQPRQGIISTHAYSIMDAVEIKGERLLKVRNPWASDEWKGAWSDGSEQWTPEWMEALNHRFGDDGIFWITYDDLLDKFNRFERTRLFDESWTIAQQWTSAAVPYSADYNATKFQVVVTKTTPIVLVLSQLDDRYFRGLEGGYQFQLRFRLVKEGEDDYIVRSQGDYYSCRSTSTDLPEIEPGTYSVLMKITAERCGQSTLPEKVIRDTALTRADKLIQIGLSFDLAHAKAAIAETEEEKEARVQSENKQKAVAKAKARKELSKQQKKAWEVGKREKARRKRDAAKKKAYLERQAAKEKANDEEESGAADDEAEGADVEAEVNGTANDEEKDAAAGAQKTQRLPTPPAEAEPAAVNGESAENEGEAEEAAEGNEAPEAAEAEDDAQPEPTPGTAEDDYLYDSDASFHSSIDSVLDLPQDDSDDEADPDAAGPEDDEADLEFASDPWNAICVVGLRVYSQDSDCTIKVIRPKPDEEALLEEDDASKGVSGKEKIDDSQVDQVEEVVNGAT